MSKEIFKPEFYHIPTIVAEQVNPHDSFVFAVIYWFVKMKEGKCFASNETIAQSLPKKSSSTSVANALNRLEEKGFIKRIFEDEERTIRKEIKCLVSYEVSPTGEGGFTQPLRGVHPQVKGGSPTGEHIRIPNKNTYKDKREKIHSLEFLKEIPEEHIRYFTKKYKVGDKQLRLKGEQLYNYVVSTGKEKHYKNFKSLLENAVMKDFGKKESDPLNY
jgi:DNA-binding MarR family transcriptional regulator